MACVHNKKHTNMKSTRNINKILYYKDNIKEVIKRYKVKMKYKTITVISIMFSITLS